MENSEINFNIVMTSKFIEAMADRVAKKINIRLDAPKEYNEMTMYSVKEVAEITKQNIRTVQAHIIDGELIASKIGKSYRILHKNLQNYIDK